MLRRSSKLSKVGAPAPREAWCEPAENEKSRQCSTRSPAFLQVTPTPSKEVSSASRLLKWRASVKSATLDLELHVTLSAGSQKSKVAESFGHGAIPRCAIHVWVAGPDGKQLAEARGSVCPKNSRSAVHVHWISRVKCEQSEWRLLKEQPEPLNAKRAWTVPQALLSIIAKIGESFGMARMELGAEDQGSQRLVQYYANLGFRSKSQAMFDELSMEAPIACIAAFAPRSWISKLPLESFNAWSWLWSHLLKPSLSAVLDMMGAPDTWRWPAEWPSGAEIQVRSCCLSDDDAKVTITAQLRCALLELVYCRAVCRLKKGSLRVIWLGASGSKPAHASVRGRLVDGTSRLTSGVTLPMALLGAVAATARWFGCHVLELTLMDNGSGRLVSYLQAFGFREGGSADGIYTSCEQFARDCCPQAWRQHLPPDSRLAVLAKLCNS